jgi:hypothetical protein
VTTTVEGYDEGLDPEELRFQRLYGPWRPASLVQAKELFDEFSRPWWIAGGWAIEAFTGVSRHHEDIDVAIWRRDVPALRDWVDDRYHVWAAGSGSLRPVTEEQPDMPDTADQVWLRKHALAPWEYDVVLNPDRDGRWVFRRDPSLDFALDDVTWVADDGIRYITPEMALVYKARLDRPKDQADLAATLPLLSSRQRAWLADLIAHLHPGHSWLTHL